MLFTAGTRDSVSLDTSGWFFFFFLNPYKGSQPLRKAGEKSQRMCLTRQNPSQTQNLGNLATVARNDGARRCCEGLDPVELNKHVNWALEWAVKMWGADRTAAFMSSWEDWKECFHYVVLLIIISYPARFVRWTVGLLRYQKHAHKSGHANTCTQAQMHTCTMGFIAFISILLAGLGLAYLFWSWVTGSGSHECNGKTATSGCN